MYALLLETVVDHIYVVSARFEMRALLHWCNSEALNLLCFSLLRLVGREHVLWSIHILDEFEVVNFLVVSAVTIFSYDHVEDVIVRRHQIECF